MAGVAVRVGPAGLQAVGVVGGEVIGSASAEMVKNSSPAPGVSVKTAVGGVPDRALDSVTARPGVCAGRRVYKAWSVVITRYSADAATPLEQP